MNILLEGLPTAINVSGQIYQINADYQTALRIITAYEDPNLTTDEKHLVLLTQLYKEAPHDVLAALCQGVKFLNCGDDTESEGLSDGVRKYSFLHDDKFIFAAVDRVLYGKLSRGEFVHWWEFYAAFLDLPEDCQMSRIIYLRTQRARGKLTKEERQQWALLRDILELPSEFTPEEIEAKNEFLQLLELSKEKR